MCVCVYVCVRLALLLGVDLSHSLFVLQCALQLGGDGEFGGANGELTPIHAFNHCLALLRYEHAFSRLSSHEVSHEIRSPQHANKYL